MSRLISRAIALGAFALTVSGCFGYIPVEYEAVPPGEHVRVFVTRTVVDDLEDITQLREPLVRGTVIRREDDGLFLRIPIGVRTEGFHSAEFGQDFLIPAREIISLERREFDRFGTGALIAGTAGAIATVIFVIMDAFGEEELEEPCEEDCILMRAPIFRIPLRP